MTELQTALTPEERQYLLALLERTLKDVRVEEHRTRTLTYREHVLHQAALLEGLLEKFRLPPGSQEAP
jgi:hypothetical protein